MNTGISFDLYGHGGMLFWMISSLFLSLVSITKRLDNVPLLMLLLA